MTAMQHEAFLREAIRLAIEGVTAGLGGPFGSVVVKEGQIVGRGCNRVTSDLDPTAHAEIVAIRDACRTLGSFSLAGCVIYASCQPCPMCLAASYWSRVDGIVYAATSGDAAAAGFDDSAISRELSLPESRRRLPVRQMAHADAAAPFRVWRESAARVPY